MSNRRVPATPEATLPAEKTLSLLRQQVESLQKFKHAKHEEMKAEHSTWVDQTAMIIRRGFGTQHPNVIDFNFSDYAVGQYPQYEREAVKDQLNFEARIKKEESCLSTYIRELELNLPEKPNDQTPPTSTPDAPRDVILLCRRLHRYIVALANRRTGRPPVVVNDEYDVQYLLNAILRLHFDDVRPEEGTGSYAGGSARMDFLLKREQTVVEAKMTRENLKDRELGNELLQDVARYKQHQDCKQLVCLIYDPSHLVANPNGLQSDLERMSSAELAVAVLIVPER
jgi:hypothetical protein